MIGGGVHFLLNTLNGPLFLPRVVLSVRLACKAFGTVPILVANAGIQQDARLLDMTLDQWRKVMAIESWDTPEKETELAKLIPYGRVGEPEGIVKAVVWLASDEFDYVTGAPPFVDGGMLLHPASREGG